MLVATTLTLILMSAVVMVFGGVGEGIAKSRRALEQFDRLRSAVQQLRKDLQGLTVTPDGRPARPEESPGYLEFTEGGMGSPAIIGSPSNPTLGSLDSNVGEHSDMLMFTTRNAAQPFVGRCAFSADPTNPTLQSDVAEVAWFLRGTTLHRRVLLVAPGVAQNPGWVQYNKLNKPNTFFQSNDISVRNVKGQLVPNSLADLTKRENRFAHPVDVFPFDVRRWGILGLPTLAECSSSTWMAKCTHGTTPLPQGNIPQIPPPPKIPPPPNMQGIDYWNSQSLPGTYAKLCKLATTPASADQVLAQDGVRVADDVVLTNVIGFDVKVWEPAPNLPNNGMPGYVDLGYLGTGPFQLQQYVFPQNSSIARFQHLGVYALAGNAQNPYPYSLVATPAFPQCVYDTGCFSNENEGIYHFDQNGNLKVDVAGGRSTNGLDDPPVPLAGNANSTALPNGVVDDIGERINSLPYPVPLRGIQVKVRCFEPDSRQIREITIEQDFLP